MQIANKQVIVGARYKQILTPEPSRSDQQWCPITVVDCKRGRSTSFLTICAKKHKKID